MTLRDISILIKKISVAVLVFMIPGVLITGGLTFATHLLNGKVKNATTLNQKARQINYNK